MLRANDRKVGEVRGFSEWMGAEVTRDLLSMLLADGFLLRPWEDRQSVPTYDQP